MELRVVVLLLQHLQRHLIFVVIQWHFIGIQVARGVVVVRRWVAVAVLFKVA